jgi:hypothetical protein
MSLLKSFFRFTQITAHICVLSLASSAAAEEPKCAGNQHAVDQCFDVRGRVYFTATSEVVLWPVGTKRLINVPHFGDILSEDYTTRLEGTAVPLPPQLQSFIEQDMVVFGDFTICPFTHSKPKVRQSACIERATNLFPLTREKWRALQDTPRP